jgi:prepilin-type N-terminal cleavage/methylation domain-containing protein
MSARRDGFSLIEVIIAMLVLSVGILAMGASTGYILSQIRAAELRTERVMAAQRVTAQLRAVAWDDLENACAHSYAVDAYTVDCSVYVPPGAIHLKRVELVTTGRAYRGGRLITNAADTMLIAFARPIGS